MIRDCATPIDLSRSKGLDERLEAMRRHEAVIIMKIHIREAMLDRPPNPTLLPPENPRFFSCGRYVTGGISFPESGKLPPQSFLDNPNSGCGLSTIKSSSLLLDR